MSVQTYVLAQMKKARKNNIRSLWQQDSNWVRKPAKTSKRAREKLKPRKAKNTTNKRKYSDKMNVEKRQDQLRLMVNRHTALLLLVNSFPKTSSLNHVKVANPQYQ